MIGNDMVCWALLSGGEGDGGERSRKIHYDDDDTNMIWTH